jgi:hypothetical protein
MIAVPQSSRKDVRTMWKLNANAAAVAVMAVMAVGWHLATPLARADSPAAPIPETQVTIKHLGFGLSQITLPQKAASRLDIRTAEIREDPSGKKIAPFSSIIYDLDGDAWVYKVTEPLTYVREAVVIEQIRREYAYLKEGPPAGTQVVTVGVPELYGTEIGVNGE